MATLLVRNRASAAAVRENIAEQLSSRLDPDSLDDVLLVASELVSNAIRHGDAGSPTGSPTCGPGLDASWELRADEVVVRVEDPSPTLPRLLPPDAFRPSGRGLAIVSAIASDWGALGVGAGKQVWARIPVRRVS